MQTIPGLRSEDKEYILETEIQMNNLKNVKSGNRIPLKTQLPPV
jgi:hypothetical protein